ncbi:hypothetical protein [Flammeovirga sp. OC4]|uniref:hypothetical protein n=1 Tax=Flammeovirga sp. OC4 TaxID=1382345 RepID=UPI0005C78EA1|nr:hypothetical protein [Flammeovirga sp. OC4]
MEYKLYFDNDQVGIIEQKDADFPNLFGKYKVLPSIEEKQVLIYKYIQYSVKASNLMEEDEMKWQDFIKQEESKYIELIESEKWILIDQNGEIHKILIPNFCDKNEIVWRWNF